MPRISHDVRLIRALRLRNQGLVVGSRPWSTATEAARGMLAVQAQDLEGAKWGLAQRAGSISIEAVEGELDAASIVRNRPSRGTLQIVAAEDLRWLTARLAGRSLAASERRRKDLGLTVAMVDAVEAVVRTELDGGSVRTRPELLAACAGAGLDLASGQASHVLGHLTQQMVIVLANPRGRTDAFALADGRISRSHHADGDEALAELVTRYVGARGPVTEACLAWWANLSLTEVRRGAAATGGAVEEVELDATRFLVARSSADLDRAATDEALTGAHLLPGFDEYLLGYRHRSPVISAEDEARVVPGANGIFKPMVVVAGAIVGIWSRTIRNSSVTVTIDPFATLPAGSPQDLARATEAYGAYLGLEPTIVVLPAG